MNSSGLLLNVFRRKIGICLFVEFVIVLLIALENIGSSRFESLWDTLNVAFGLAAALSLLLWFQTGCNRLPFPVSVRQRAWLPMIAFGIICAAGGLAITLAALWQPTVPYSLLWSLPSVLGRIPLYLLAFMVVIRIVRGKPFLIGFLFWFPIFIRSDRFEWFDACLSSYSLWWPLALAALAYYVWEAPAHLGQQDRLMVGQTGGIHSFPIRDMQISERRVPRSWMGDAIEHAMLPIAGLLFFTIILKSGTFFDGLSYPFLIFPLLVIGSAVMMFRAFFHQAQCSGFSTPRAIGLGLMQMTAILVPLAQAMGVRKGLAAWCDSCRKRKFVWQFKCPHCENPGPGTVSNKHVAALVQGKPMQMPLRGRMVMKAMIPLQIVFMGVIAGGMSGRPFVSNGVSLVFGQSASLQAKEMAIDHVKEWIEANPSLEDWQLGSPVGEHVPEKFRLIVTTYSTKSLSLRGLGLRWDPAVILSERIAEHLAESLADICPVRVVLPKKTRRTRGGTFQIRGYLDNQIHWKEPRK